MEKGRVKLFAEVNDQEIRYAAFELPTAPHSA